MYISKISILRYSNLVKTIRIFIFSILVMLRLTFMAQTATMTKPLEGVNTTTQSISYAVVQEKSGLLWIATEEGVLSHNSTDFKIYNNYRGLDAELSNRVTTLFTDSTG